MPTIYGMKLSGSTLFCPDSPIPWDYPTPEPDSGLWLNPPASGIDSTTPSSGLTPCLLWSKVTIRLNGSWYNTHYMEINNAADDAPYNCGSVLWNWEVPAEALDADGNPRIFNLHFGGGEGGASAPGRHFIIPHLSTDDTRGLTIDYTQPANTGYIDFYLNGVYGAGGRNESGMILGKKYTISVFVFRSSPNTLT